MGNFWTGFFLGIAVGQALLFALVRFNAHDIIRLWSRRAWRRGERLFWRGLEVLLNYLDGLLARKRARDAGDLGSPNLIG
jgi:phosphatidylglycerophosphate synthase